MPQETVFKQVPYLSLILKKKKITPVFCKNVMKPQNYIQLISNITKLWEFSLQFYTIREGKKPLNFNSPHKVLIQDFTSNLL